MNIGDPKVQTNFDTNIMIGGTGSLKDDISWLPLGSYITI